MDRIRTRRETRRGWLALTAGAIAGCASPADDTTSPTTDARTQARTDTQSARDRREANVVGTSFEAVASGYRFEVTLDHDDAGEEGYANWWQVERIDGTRLGRRELAHPHDQQPFTRSGTVEVPDDVTCVVVRGHDQTHGYGGQAAVVALDSGESRIVDQGGDRQALAAADCP